MKLFLFKENKKIWSNIEYQSKKKEVLVLALIAIAVKLVSDFRSCKSVIDELLSILNLVQNFDYI